MSDLTAGLSKLGLNPVKYDKKGPAYDLKDVKALVKRRIEADAYFSERVKKTMSDTTTAIEKTNDVMKEFTLVIDKYTKLEADIVEKSKKTTGTLKDSAERLAQGIARVEKAANFERLERYVGLLERAATAMNLLAELEKEGKLDKIAGALK